MDKQNHFKNMCTEVIERDIRVVTCRFVSRSICHADQCHLVYKLNVKGYIISLNSIFNYFHVKPRIPLGPSDTS